MPAQDVWRVEITNREEVGDVWHALESMVNYFFFLKSYEILYNLLQVRLIHVNTSAALAFSGRLLPDWGHNQHEIVGDVMINQPNTIFNVEEHRYTRSNF